MFQTQNRETKLVLEKLLCPQRSLWRRVWQDCISQYNTKPASPRPRPIFLVSDRSCPKTDGLSPHHWSGGALWAVGFGAEPWPPKDFFTIFSTQGGLSLTIILYYCGSQKWKIL